MVVRFNGHLRWCCQQCLLKLRVTHDDRSINWEILSIMNWGKSLWPMKYIEMKPHEMCDIFYKPTHIRMCTNINRKYISVHKTVILIRMTSFFCATFSMWKSVTIMLCIIISMVSCQKGPARHAYAWQIGPFWQDTLDMKYCKILVT